MIRKNNSEHGNALIFVLITVVLFIALSYAVTSSSRIGSDSLSREKLELYATEILSYSTTVEKAIGRMRMRQSILEGQLSFDAPETTGYTNAACTDNTCRVLHTDGGGIQYQDPSIDWLDSSKSAEANYGEWVFTSANNVQGIGSDGAATLTTAKDLIIILPWIRQELCIELNERIGMNNPSGVPPVDDGNLLMTKFTGAYAAGQILNDTGTDIDGQNSGCFETTQISAVAKADSFHFYRVLLAR